MRVIKYRYIIKEKLGQGGTSITYAALDQETNQTVALKALSLTGLEDWKKIELFEREAKILQQLNHPAIPKYIDYFTLETEKDKAFYLVQEQAPGKSLAQLIANGWHTTEQKVKNIAQQILEILIYLHSLDPPVIHRDLKPNNLIRSDEGKIYLVDFGAVQNTYYNTLVQGSTVVGTYGYMAPEQFRGKALPATDLYSLGATLLYLLTHRSPAELSQDTLKLDFRNYVDISESFGDWLDKILEPDLDERFSSAELALNQLFAGKRKRQHKLIARVGIGVLCLSIIWGLNSYKWWLLSRLGYQPDGLCSEPKVMSEYLKEGGNINLITTYNYTSNMLVSHCILRGLERRNNSNLLEKENIVKLLVKRGADINVKNHYGDYLLFTTKNIDFLKNLIKNGADVNVKDIHGTSLLSYAIRTKNIDIVRLIIENGADVNAQDKNGKTLLFKTKNIDIAKLLIENGADINSQDKYGRTPLSDTTNLDIAKLLIENSADINAQNYRGEIPLFYVENIDIAKLLIENGADVNAQNYRGETPLYKAAAMTVIDDISLVYVNEEDRSPYWIKFLIKNAADVNVQNSRGETPLFHAKNIDIAKLLIENGADVNFQNNFGVTPLVIAIWKQDKESIELLIDNGADTKYLDYENFKQVYARYTERFHKKFFKGNEQYKKFSKTELNNIKKILKSNNFRSNNIN